MFGFWDSRVLQGGVGSGARVAETSRNKGTLHLGSAWGEIAGKLAENLRAGAFAMHLSRRLVCVPIREDVPLCR